MENTVVNDRYLIKFQIGFGGYAKVFLAFDKVINKNVAIKFVKCDLTENSKTYKMFKQEAMTMAALSNHNIVKIYESGIHNNNPYLVMEYLNGKSLKEIIKENGYLLVDEVVSYYSQIINGIAACHNANIIHRDIKPSNIIKQLDGNVVLLDFGTAFIGDEDKNLYHEDENSAIGTIHYMAPEIFTSPEGSVQTDIYALGVMMYEMFTGHLPFTTSKNDDKAAIVRLHMYQPFPSVRNFNPDVPIEFENIIYKCCEKDPKKRYKNVSELHLDILEAYEIYKNPTTKKKKFLEKLFGKKK